MQSKAQTVQAYLDEIPEERKSAFSTLRDTIIKNIPSGFEEEMSYGMIGYVVPKAIYPNGYHCDTKLPLPFVNIASQKNAIGLYHMGIYAQPKILDWFVTEYPKYCKYKLDMGKSCIRFKKLDQIPFELLAQLMQKMSVQDWIAIYEKHFKR